MTGSTRANGSRNRPPGESELTAQLITAAGTSPGPLSHEEVDEILGVHPDEADDQG